MKHLLLTTIAAVVLVGCGESQQSAPAPESKPVEPVADAAKPEGQPEPPTAKAPDISIHKAAGFKGNIEAVKQHLAAGADMNAKTGDGTTPLHNAAVYGRNEIAELLIANGAAVNAKIEAGKFKDQTSLDRAIKLKRTETADLLRKHGGKTGEELKAEGK